MEQLKLFDAAFSKAEISPFGVFVMSDIKVYRVLSAFERATTRGQYLAAKRLCVKLFDAQHQLAFVDAARSARSRITALAVGGAL